jgi:hypothetical protein
VGGFARNQQPKIAAGLFVHDGARTATASVRRKGVTALICGPASEGGWDGYRIYRMAGYSPSLFIISVSVGVALGYFRFTRGPLHVRMLDRD